MIKRNLLSMLTLCGLTSVSIQAAAVSAAEAVDGLAQGCYVIKSPTVNKYIKQYQSGGTANGGERFGFKAASVAEANSFFFKPTRFKHFMMTNADGRYMATTSPANSTAGTSPGESAEWNIEAIQQGENEFRYRFKAIGLNRTLHHNYATDDLTFFTTLNPNNDSETAFELIPAANCVAYPEIETNVTGSPDLLKGNANLPVRGFVDAHAHIASYEFMGGKFVHGDPFHRFGVTEALNDSAVIHGENGSLDLLGNIFAYDDPGFRYDTRGWPDFPHWPTHRDVSHTGYYYKWIERAYLGGLRMVVSHMVENKALCSIQSLVNPAAQNSPNSCEAMDSVRLQVQRLHEMQDYIDAQHGGPGKGFFRIVTSPLEARQVIADGKLAVFMGIEVSELFDCGIQGGCTRHSVEQQLQEVYDLGIRGIFPTHRFDNKIGGAKLEGGFLNAGQWLSAGYLFDTKECDAGTRGAQLEPGFPVVEGIPVLGDIIGGISNAPDYDPNIRHCNRQGLSELGVYLINRMIDMGMLIELDHAAEKTAASILDIVETRNYSGVISAHSHLSARPDNGLHVNFKRLVQTGGFVSPYNKSAYDLAQDIDKYLSEVETTAFAHGVSFGTDMTGLANQPGPRADAQTDPLQYPFTNEFGLVFDKQKSGNRVLDYNAEGMAHYGMLADHVQDIREQTSSRIYEAVMNSTEAYLQMWERATANNSAYHNSLEQTVKVVTQLNGDCLGVAGRDEDVVPGVPARHAPCFSRPRQADQHWIYDGAQGTFKNSANPSLCLDSREAFSGGIPRLLACENTNNSRWLYADYTLRSAVDSSWVLDAMERVGHVLLYGYHGRDNQDWELRTEREVYNWITLRPYNRDGCIDVQDENTANGTFLRFERCDPIDGQQFLYNPATGAVTTKLDTNKCVTVPNGNVSNGNRLVIWDCNGDISQQWDFDNGVFRSRIDSNKVWDVTNSENIVIYSSHGGGNQRWKTILQ
ncbi:hypothetical protein FKG94_09470 [Exilibacterium tricleocarpae]|uniref:Ricin B lectin domain-containing protein n=1 Tax=Exilibacterium tricleocarpae TaxID=2591008 RepID=A0A545TVT3_9GAMM|nr:ricin-type beta-trefoil lectin domain protein [Exilibacterium tricleocarpae]TQV81312.1 hypothetical protein FKG94_09470 [Exilibacterium tricleocarpae]